MTCNRIACACDGSCRKPAHVLVTYGVMEPCLDVTDEIGKATDFLRSMGMDVKVVLDQVAEQNSRAAKSEILE